MSYSIIEYHGSFNITKRSGAIKYIVVHYTGSGTSASGAAKANCVYFSNGNRNASAHYFIDDGSIYEYADPGKYATWHCGDGKGKYGITNQNSIGIEVCRNHDQPFTQAEINRLAWLVRKLMKQYGVPASRVVRHYDASRKQCPMYYAKRDSEWIKLRNAITRGEGAWKKNSIGWWWEYEDGSYPASEWMKISSVWYWFKSSGYAACNEWEKVNGKWYYFDSLCHMVTGWRKVDGRWYHMDSSGAMQTGWYFENGAWYWLKSDGVMASDETLYIGGKWYAFASSGNMRKDVEIDESGNIIA